MVARPTRTPGMPVLEIRDLAVRLPRGADRPFAIEDISFTVGAGEIVCVVGESGSGKSVTAFTVMGLNPRELVPVKGQIILDGEDLLKKSSRAMRRLRGEKMAMIFQEPMTALNPVMTVGEQIMETVQRHLKVPRREARERAIEALRRVGIPSPEQRVDDYPHRLSGGMRQRVMIAIGLACEPDVLIADEPTTALDVTTQAQIIDEIRRLQERMGTSLIWITHDLGVVAGLADEVIVMYGGRIMESAPVGELYRGRHNPYTRGLLSSLPRTGAERPHRLAAIPGLPPDPITLPAGCPFAPRCPHVEDTCRDERPALRDTGDQHRSACHFEPQELYR
jgi:oligopeptide/dipeptide ABC transporter ATP-binding protein